VSSKLTRGCFHESRAKQPFSFTKVDQGNFRDDGKVRAIMLAAHTIRNRQSTAWTRQLIYAGHCPVFARNSNPTAYRVLEKDLQ
jgi:hypothetical protein